MSVDSNSDSSLSDDEDLYSLQQKALQQLRDKRRKQIKKTKTTTTLIKTKTKQKQLKKKKKDIQQQQQQQLYCICKRPFSSDDPNLSSMIQCDICDDWFHWNCVNLTIENAKALELTIKSWTCPSCSIPSNTTTKEEEEDSSSMKTDIIKKEGEEEQKEINNKQEEKNNRKRTSAKFEEEQIRKKRKMKDDEKKEIQINNQNVEIRRRKVKAALLNVFEDSNLSIAVEQALHDKDGYDATKYLRHSRELMQNLRDSRNSDLLQNIKENIITPTKLAEMSSKELAPAELSKWRSSHDSLESVVVSTRHPLLLPPQLPIVTASYESESSFSLPTTSVKKSTSTTTTPLSSSSSSLIESSPLSSSVVSHSPTRTRVSSRPLVGREDVSFSPLQRNTPTAHLVWKGTLLKQQTQPTFVFHISLSQRKIGSMPLLPSLCLLPSSLDVVGRISINSLLEFAPKLTKSNRRQGVLFACNFIDSEFTPAQLDDFCNYYSEHDRAAVCDLEKSLGVLLYFIPSSAFSSSSLLSAVSLQHSVRGNVDTVPSFPLWCLGVFTSTAMDRFLELPPYSDDANLPLSLLPSSSFPSPPSSP